MFFLVISIQVLNDLFVYKSLQFFPKYQGFIVRKINHKDFQIYYKHMLHFIYIIFGYIWCPHVQKWCEHVIGRKTLNMYTQGSKVENFQRYYISPYLLFPHKIVTSCTTFLSNIPHISWINKSSITESGKYHILSITASPYLYDIYEPTSLTQPPNSQIVALCMDQFLHLFLCSITFVLSPVPVACRMIVWAWTSSSKMRLSWAIM